MNTRKNGFEYIDLNSPDVTQGYRPHPGSKPMEVYVAELSFDERDRQIVGSVYRLVTRKHPSIPGKEEFVTRRSDGRTLGVRVNRGPVVESLQAHYDERFS